MAKAKGEGGSKKAEVRDVEATATMPARPRQAGQAGEASGRRGRGRPAGQAAGGAGGPGGPAAAGQETVQTSIRMSDNADQLLDRLVVYLNEIREEGTEPWTRTQVLELALRDWWPAWLASQRDLGMEPEVPESLRRAAASGG